MQQCMTQRLEPSTNGRPRTCSSKVFEGAAYLEKVAPHVDGTVNTPYVVTIKVSGFGFSSAAYLWFQALKFSSPLFRERMPLRNGRVLNTCYSPPRDNYCVAAWAQ